MPLYVGFKGEKVELTEANTFIMLFQGDDLDHVMVAHNGVAIVNYAPDLMTAAMASHQFPLVIYPNRPEWAIERRLKSEPDDVDRLLDD